jgi:hypothetical protein
MKQFIFLTMNSFAGINHQQLSVKKSEHLKKFYLILLAFLNL